jgi:hypothetical protein
VTACSRSRPPASSGSTNALWFYAAKGQRLLKKNADARVVTGISRSFLPGPFIYLTATLVALASPITSVIMYVAITLFYVAESSIFARSQHHIS